jgi:hypothetical protein
MQVVHAGSACRRLPPQQPSLLQRLSQLLHSGTTARHQPAHMASTRAAALPQLVQCEAEPLLQSREAADGLAFAAQRVRRRVDELRQEAALAVLAAVGVSEGCGGVCLGALHPLVH